LFGPLESARAHGGLTELGNADLPDTQILRETGFDERTIADALGQRTIEMARHYAKGADLTKKMRGVAKKFEREVNRRRTKVSNLAAKVPNLDTNPEAEE
jgi:hypothetical protein